jgi:hypothetical protein
MKQTHVNNNGFLVSGYGLLTCKEFASNKLNNRPLYDASLQWIHGYLSGLCQAGHLFLGKGSFEGQLEPELVNMCIDEFSQDNPDSVLNEAAARLYARFTNEKSPRVIH